MKKSIALWVLSLCASLIFAAAFEIEGKAVIAQVDEMPEGLFAKTVGYLPGDCLNVTNQKTGNTCELLVLGAIDPAEGIAVLLTPEAASSLNVSKNDDIQVSVTKRSGELDDIFIGKAIIAADSQFNIETENPKVPVLTDAVEESTEQMVSNDSIEDLESTVSQDSFEMDLQKITMKSPAEEGYKSQEEQVESEVQEVVIEDGEDVQEDVKKEIAEAEPVESEVQEVAEAEPVESEVQEIVIAEPEDVQEDVKPEIAEAEPVESEVQEVVIADGEDVQEDVKQEIAEAEPVESEVQEVIIADGEDVQKDVKPEIAEAEPVESEVQEVVIPEPEESIAQENQQETVLQEEVLDDLIAAEDGIEETVEEDPKIAVSEDEMIFATDDVVVPDPVPDSTPVANVQDKSEYEPIILPQLQDSLAVSETVPEVEEITEEETEYVPVDEPEVLVPSTPIVIEPVPVSPEPESRVASNNNNSLLQKHLVESLNLLSKDKYYIQIAIMGDVSNIDTLFAKYSKYPLIAVPRASREYMILAGPCSEDEYGTLLAKFKSFGFKDAFVKRLK